MKISLREIIDIFCTVLDGLKQQGRPGEFERFQTQFPRDPIFIAQGLEAAFGISIGISPVDFYDNVNIPDDRKDFFTFIEYNENDNVTIYINKARIENGRRPLLSEESARFSFLKECCTAAIRAAITKGIIQTAASYPDTINFEEISVALLDWIGERYPVYAFERDEFAPTVTVENAAELLAIMLLVDIPVLYRERRKMDVRPKPIWDVEDFGSINHDDPEADLKFALFEYEKYAEKYKVKVRFLIVLVRTDFIVKIVDTIIAFGRKLTDLFFDFSDDDA
jgi:hypothetical protein